MDKAYLIKFLRAIGEGAKVTVDNYRYIVVANPNFEFTDPAEGQDPFLVIDVDALERSTIFK